MRRRSLSLLLALLLTPALVVPGCALDYEVHQLGTRPDGDPIREGETPLRMVLTAGLSGDEQALVITAAAEHQETTRQPLVKEFESEFDVTFGDFSSGALDSDAWILFLPIAMAMDITWGTLSFLIMPIAAAVSSGDEALPGDPVTRTISDPLLARELFDADGRTLDLTRHMTTTGTWSVPLTALRAAGLHAERLRLRLADEAEHDLPLPAEVRARLIEPTVWVVWPRAKDGALLPVPSPEPPRDRPAQAPARRPGKLPAPPTDQELDRLFAARRAALSPPGPTGQVEVQRDTPSKGLTATVSVLRLANGGWQAHGPAKAVWTDSGQLAWTWDYKHGKRCGEAVRYRSPDSRQGQGAEGPNAARPLSRSIYEDDKQDGPAATWPDEGGFVLSEYRAGKLTGLQREWGPGGRLTTETEYRTDGSYTIARYDGLGQLQTRVTYDAQNRGQGLAEQWSLDLVEAQGDVYKLVPLHQGSFCGWVTEYGLGGRRKADYQVDTQCKPLGRRIDYDGEGQLQSDQTVIGWQVVRSRVRPPWPLPITLRDAQGQRLGGRSYGLWHQVPAAPGAPPPLAGATLTWDPVRQGCLLVGGSDGQKTWGQTWLWNGSAWGALPTPGRELSPRVFHGAAWDQARQRLVVFGGLGADGQPLDETWELGPDGWERRQSASVPTARAFGALVHDPERRLTYLIGGRGRDASTGKLTASVPGTWAWDGRDWRLLPDTGAPVGEAGVAVTWDEDRRAVVLHGGASLLGASPFSSAFDGTTWRNVAAAQQPPAASLHAAVYDRDGHQVLVLANDEKQGELTVSCVGSLYDSLLWVRTGRGGLGPRSGFAAAYDPLRKQVVVYGGEESRAGKVRRLSETWLLGDDSDADRDEQERRRVAQESPGWTIVSHLEAENAPDEGAADPRTGRALLVGKDGVWVWRDQGWRRLEVEPAPAPRTEAMVVYDLQGERWLVTGGKTFDAQGAELRLHDVWACDGQTWTRLSEGTPLPTGVASYAPATFDAQRGQWVVFDQYGGKTWVLAGPEWRWSEAPQAGGPAQGALQSGRAVCVPRQGVMLLGQIKGEAGQETTRLWTWSGTAWTDEREAPRLEGPIQALFLDPVRRGLWVLAGPFLHLLEGERWKSWIAPRRPASESLGLTAGLVRGRPAWVDPTSGELRLWGSVRGMGMWLTTLGDTWRFDPQATPPATPAQVAAFWQAEHERQRADGERMQKMLEEALKDREGEDADGASPDGR